MHIVIKNISPYVKARLVRLAKEKGESVEKFTSELLARLVDAAFCRAQKGDTHPQG